ncbi:MAG: DNA internalization-related competence protein ComEC/Rec2 [Gammaproteobacteria bacterium]|nr:DNA internalization-related competence protein ComEC/Rec2 [Gammaproteobacteria bacterium]
MKKYSLIFLLGNLSVWQLSSLNEPILITFLLLSASLIIVLLISNHVIVYRQKSYQLNAPSSKQNFHYHLIFSILIFNFAFSITWHQAQQRILNNLPKNLEAKEVLLVGKIDSIPSYIKQTRWVNKNSPNIYLAKFNFKLINHPHNKSNFYGRIKTSWYRLKLDEAKQLKIGQIWQFKLKLKAPSGLLNPGGFDYEQWLFQENIQASAYVRKGPDNKLISEENLSGLDLSSTRQHLADNLRNVLSDNTFKGIYLALTLGLKDDIANEHWKVLTETGTNHLMAISGLHIGLIAGLGFLIGRWLWSLSTFIIYKINRQHFSLYFAFAFAFIYAALAGFSIPTQRALIMLFILSIGLISRYRIHPLNILAWTLIIVLVWAPFSSLSLGFWLSFSAVAIILLSVMINQRWDFKKKLHNAQQDMPVLLEQTDNIFIKLFQWLKSLVLIQVVLFVGLMPLTVIFFDRFALVSPVANFILVPVMSFIVIPLTLFNVLLLEISPNLSKIIFQYLSELLAYLWDGLVALSNYSNNLIYLTQSQLLLGIIIVLTVIILWFLIKTKEFKFRLLFMFMLATIWSGLLWSELLFIKTTTPLHGQFKMSILDVGQGLSIVVKTRNHTLVYDTGNKFSERFNMAEQVLLPFLHKQGINKIDRLILSHADHDHAGASEFLLKKIKVGSIFSGETQRINKKFSIDSSACISGQKWSWDGVAFEVLSPFESQPARKSNNLSCVILITSKLLSKKTGLKKMASNKEFKVLIPGDIEKTQELFLLKQDNLRNKLSHINVLIAGHHGSKTSSSAEFIEQTQASYVIYTNAYKHFYNFPHHSVVKRFSQISAKQESTSNGTIAFFSPMNKTDGIELEIYRRDRYKIWNRKYQSVDNLQN